MSLRKMKRGTRVDSLREVAARVELEVAPAIYPRVIQLGVALVEVAGRSSPRLVHSETKRSHSPKPTRDRIRSALFSG